MYVETRMKASRSSNSKNSYFNFVSYYLSLECTFYTDAPEKAQNILKELRMWLKEKHMTATDSPEKCDFILAVCPVVSRLGVDVERCGDKLRTIPGKP